MKVGTICKLKVDCLGNKAGTLGVVYYDYGDGCQVMFENGRYDGFSRTGQMATVLGGKTEQDYFLEEVGFEESLAGYHFKSVMQVSEDYRNGLFNIVWAEIAMKSFPAEQLLYCNVYADATPSHWLRFKRSGQSRYLSTATDFADFSHFEYAAIGSLKSVFPRWIQGERTLYPEFVVFHKKL